MSCSDGRSKGGRLCAMVGGQLSWRATGNQREEAEGERRKGGMGHFCTASSGLTGQYWTYQSTRSWVGRYRYISYTSSPMAAQRLDWGRANSGTIADDTPVMYRLVILNAQGPGPGPAVATVMCCTTK